MRQNDVQLPDEYDQIYHDLEPFWGLDPLQLREALDEVAKLKDSYTLGKREWDAPITVLSDNLPPARKQDMLAQVAKPMMDLLKDVYKFIPPFQGAFSPHDNPELLVDHSWKSEALAAAANGTGKDWSSLIISIEVLLLIGSQYSVTKICHKQMPKASHCHVPPTHL